MGNVAFQILTTPAPSDATSTWEVPPVTIAAAAPIGAAVAVMGKSGTSGSKALTAPQSGSGGGDGGDAGGSGRGGGGGDVGGLGGGGNQRYGTNEKQEQEQQEKLEEFRDGASRSAAIAAFLRAPPPLAQSVTISSDNTNFNSNNNLNNNNNSNNGNINNNRRRRGVTLRGVTLPMEVQRQQGAPNAAAAATPAGGTLFEETVVGQGQRRSGPAVDGKGKDRSQEAGEGEAEGDVRDVEGFAAVLRAREGEDVSRIQLLRLEVSHACFAVDLCGCCHWYSRCWCG